MQSESELSLPQRLWRGGRALEKGGYPGFQPRIESVDGIECAYDVAVPMRDGVTIYVDLFRPVPVEGRVPALIAWSPYGKHERGPEIMDRYPNRAGVPAGVPGRWTKFEAPDPDYWCRHGYAVVNADTRGGYMSGGDMYTVGGKEADDIHDLVEWLAGQPWCSEKVGMSGNSWLAQCQWFAAATQPPHLAAIAPWEGWSDLYREDVAPGGISTEPVNWMKFIWAGMCSRSKVEDPTAMVEAHPTWNAYWDEKKARLDRVTVPAYVVASWNSRLHARGSFEGFKNIASEQKWLRIHDGWEWPDYYEPSNVEDLRRFFDHFLRGVDNGWEATPRVRVAIMDQPTDRPSQVYRVEADWPPARTRHVPLYLDGASAALTTEPAAVEASVGYVATEGRAVFDHRFDEDTELTGHMSLRLWVEAVDADDLDLFVVTQKLLTNGDHADFTVYGMGWAAEPARGFLRVSHRELDAETSTPEQPRHTHRVEQMLAPGEVVEIEVEFWPMGCLWRAGETLRLVVAGHPLLHAGDPVTGSALRSARNRGTHVLWTGGRYPARLLVPRTPDAV